MSTERIAELERELRALKKEASRAKRKATMQDAWARPEVRAKLKAAMQDAWARPEVRAKRKATMNRPEVRAKLKAAMNRPEVRAKLKVAAALAREIKDMRDGAPSRGRRSASAAEVPRITSLAEALAA